MAWKSTEELVAIEAAKAAAKPARIAAMNLPANWATMSDSQRNQELIRRQAAKAASPTTQLRPMTASEAAFEAELARCNRWTEHEGCIIHGHMCR